MPDFIYHRGARHTIGPDRDEEPRAACADNLAPFDTLHDSRAGFDHREAVREVMALCGKCPIQQDCHRDNRREDWFTSFMRGVRFLVNNPSVDRPKPPALEQDELMRLHSRYVSLRRRGAHIPDEVRDGERQYQQRRKQIQRGRERSAA